MWSKWDGKRVVKTEELYSKAADLMHAGVDDKKINEWSMEKIMDLWEELYG